MFGSLGGPELAMVAFVMIGSLIVVAFPASRICVRIGFPAWVGILAVLPLVNIGLLWFVAFTEWPKAVGSPSTGSSTTA
jgi:hypothetical protein